MSSSPFLWSVPPTLTVAAMDEDKTRADTPDSGGGGYFTLSESEVGSNNDGELKNMKDFNQSPKKYTFGRKIFSGLRSRSGTPPRPSPPKDYQREVTPPRPSPPKLTRNAKAPERKSLTDEPLPPKPPPPLFYTSTLPPPVPKKITNRNLKSRSKTLPLRKVSISKDKPITSKQTNTQSPAMEILQQTGSVESVLPQSSSEECIQSSSPLQSSDEECLQSMIIPHTDIMASQKHKQTITLPESGKENIANLSVTHNNDLTETNSSSEKTPSKDIRKSSLNTSNSKPESTFLTSFRKSNQLTTTNSLNAIGQLDETEPAKKKTIEGPSKKEKEVKRRSGELRKLRVGKASIEKGNKVQQINKSEESKKCQVTDNTIDKAKKKRDSLSHKVGQESSSVSGKKFMNMSQKSNEKSSSQMSIASESLAERAKHSSQEQLNKLKKHVFLEEIVKYKHLGLQALDLKRDSPDKRKECDTISRSASCSSGSLSKSSRSTLSLAENKQLDKEKSLTNLKGKGKRSKLFSVNSFSDLIKRSEKKTRKERSVRLNGNESPIVLEDKSNKISARSGHASPTPSLESSISMTLTENSSLAPSTLDAVSEITSEMSLDCWLTAPDQDSNMADLDKYVLDMMASTQDINTPRTSPDITSKELVVMLQLHRRQSTCEETKSSLKSIIDQIERLKPKFDDSSCLQSYSLVTYAGSYCCTPPAEEETVSDWFELKENVCDKQLAELLEEKENVLVDPTNIKVNREIIVRLQIDGKMNKTANETKTLIVVNSATKEKKLGLKEKHCEDNRPTPSPRLKRKIKRQVHQMDEDKTGKVSNTSISCFNELISDLFLPGSDLEYKSCDSNIMENSPCSNESSKIDNVSPDNLDENRLIEEMEDIKFNQEKLLRIIKNKMEEEMEEKEKYRNLAEQFETEIENIKSQCEEHAKEKKIWTEKETYLMFTQKDLKKMLNAKSVEVEDLKVNVDTQLCMIANKDKEITELHKGIATVESEQKNLGQLNDKIEEDLRIEILELKEIKTELISLIDIKQKIDGEGLIKQEETLKQQLKFREKEVKELEEKCLEFQNENLAQTNQKSLLINKQESELKEVNDIVVTNREGFLRQIKTLEDQLEQEHQEKTQILEERQSVDRNISKLEISQNKDELITKLKIDLKKRGILLRDAQNCIDSLQKENNNRLMVKHLKNQIEDLECEKAAMIRARKHSEIEFEEYRHQEENLTNKNKILEERYMLASQENSSLSSQILENEDELQEIMKKYKNSVSSISTDQIALQDQALNIIELEKDNERLKEERSNLLYKIDELEENKETSDQKSLQLKVTELEHKIELEKTTRNRMETQIGRLRETVEQFDKEAEELRLKTKVDQEKQRKLLNQLRDLKEDYISLQGKEVHVSEQKNILENKLVIAESKNIVKKKDLEMALRRIDDFQIAINSEICSDTDTVNYSDDFDEDLDVFLEKTKITSNVHEDHVFRDSIAKEIIEKDSGDEKKEVPKET